MSILSNDVYNCIPVQGNINIWPGMAYLNNKRVRGIYCVDSKTSYQQWLYQTQVLLEKMELLDMSSLDSWIEWIKKFLIIRKGLHLKFELYNVVYGTQILKERKRCYLSVWKYATRKKNNRVSIYNATIETKSDLANEIIEKLFSNSTKIEIEL